MYGRLVGLNITLESSHISFLTPFSIYRSTLALLMNVIQYPYGWQVRFGQPPDVHPFLNYTLLPVLALVSIYLLILLKFFLLPLLILLSLSLLLSLP